MTAQDAGQGMLENDEIEWFGKDIILATMGLDVSFDKLLRLRRWIKNDRATLLQQLDDLTRERDEAQAQLAEALDANAMVVAYMQGRYDGEKMAQGAWQPIDDGPWDGLEQGTGLTIGEQGQLMTFDLGAFEVEIDLHEKRICLPVKVPAAPVVPVEVLEALQMTYRKHHLEDDSIGWNELSDTLLNVLCEIMGDKGYQVWLASLNGGEHAT